MARSPREGGWELKGAARERYVKDLFDRIAKPYDRLNRVISLGRDRAWRARVVDVSGAALGAHIVDLGTGTGDLAGDFARVVGATGRVIGVDLSSEMLRVAQTKVGDGNVRFVRGRADATGLLAHWADVVSMGWVLRNVGDRAAAYAEILRLLRPGGRFVSVDMSRPRAPWTRAGFWAYRHLMMPVLARASGGDGGAYRYLARSTDRFPTSCELVEELWAAGFERVSATPLMMGSLAIHAGQKPG